MGGRRIVQWVRRRSAALTIAAAIGSAVGIGGYIYSDAQRQTLIYEHQAREKADKYIERAYIQAQTRCLLVAPENKRECVREEAQAARQGEHDEYDLQAQLVTSAWTRAMGIAALVAMVFGIVGVGLVYLTFSAQQRSTRIAQREYGRARLEAREAAKKARDANRISEQTAERQLRPYLLFQGIRVIEKNDAGQGYWEFFFDVINNGQTPARVTLALVGRSVVTNDHPSFDEVQLNGDRGPVIPKDGTASFVTRIGKPTLAPGTQQFAGGVQISGVLVLAKLEYCSLTDTETQSYISERGRRFAITTFPSDGYGPGKSEANEDPRTSRDHIT